MNFDETMEGTAQTEQSGEASSQTRAKGDKSRLYCPVPGCPKGVMSEAAVWMASQALRNHLNEHASGRLLGALPESWLRENQSSLCPVCGLIVSNRFGGVCPKCRPKHRTWQAQEVEGRPLAEGMPTWHEIGTDPINTKAYVPKGAKKLWAQCVASALNQISGHGDDKAWREWHMLPKPVLRSVVRGGGKNA